MIKKLKIFLFILFYLYQTSAFSKATDENDFNPKYLSNYLSAIILQNNLNTADSLKYFNSSKILDIHPVQGLLLRVIDKVQRIRSFTNDKELSVPNETVEDACDDIVNYAILAKAMLLDERSQIKPLDKQTYAVGEGDMPYENDK